MYSNRYIMILTLGALVSLSACEDESEDRLNTPDENNSVEPDNSAYNDADLDLSEDNKTPIDQSESSEAIDVTAQIRRAIIDDDRMSVNAQNIKIITDESGLVTLRGVVESPAEMNAIDAIANSVDGVTEVDNQLEVNTN